MPRTKKFTDDTIKENAVPGKRLHVSGTPNLYLYTSAGPKRKQRWILRISRPRPRKAPDDKSKRKSNVTERSLGPYPAVSIEMAKNRAEHARLIIARDKIDPWKVDWNDGATTTYGEVVAKWIEEKKSSWKTEKQLHDTQYLLLIQPLLEKPILKIKPKDIHDALRARWEHTPKQIRRALPKIENVFDYAKVNRWFFGDNPARWKWTMEHLFRWLPKPDHENFAAMPYEDVPEFMRALRQHQNSSVAAVALEFCMLTATRSIETRGMKWSEIPDFEKNRLWTIPKERMKKGRREHTVPLPARALEILTRRKEQAVGKQHVFFAHQRDEPLDETSMRRVLREMGKSVTVHGFRSSFRDWAGDETDHARETAEACLAHQVGNDVERRYRRRTALEKRRALMEAWASFCEGNTTAITST